MNLLLFVFPIRAVNGVVKAAYTHRNNYHQQDAKAIRKNAMQFIGL